MCRVKKDVAALGAVILIVVFCIPDVYAETLTFRDKLGRDVSIRLPVRWAVLFETYELTAASGLGQDCRDQPLRI